GLLGSILFVAGFYRLGILGAVSVGGGKTPTELSRSFVHSLVPIGVVYALAHYISLLLIQGQAMVFLVSNPLGSDADYFGTAAVGIDYAIAGQSTYWYLQVAFVVLGHVGGLALAHDRALAIYSDARLAVRSQYWMLAVMLGFTSLALWLLASANQS
nr:fenitrothion hydrolase [Thermoleophilaceae bacterium]